MFTFPYTQVEFLPIICNLVTIVSGRSFLYLKGHNDSFNSSYRQDLCGNLYTYRVFDNNYQVMINNSIYRHGVDLTWYSDLDTLSKYLCDLKKKIISICILILIIDMMNKYKLYLAIFILKKFFDNFPNFLEKFNFY